MCQKHYVVTTERMIDSNEDGCWDTRWHNLDWLVSTLNKVEKGEIKIFY